MKTRHVSVSDAQFCLGIVLFWILIFCIGMVTPGCTVAPREVTSASIAIGDNGTPNAGILSKVVDSKGRAIGYYVDQGYVDNYRFMIAAYGRLIQPPVTDMTGTVHANGRWYIDAKHAGIYAQLVGVEIDGK